VQELKRPIVESALPIRGLAGAERTYNWEDTYRVGADGSGGVQRLAAPYISSCAGHLGKAVLVTGLLHNSDMAKNGATLGGMTHMLSRLAGNMISARDLYGSVKLWLARSFIPYELFETASGKSETRYRPTPAGTEVLALNGLMLSLALSKRLAAPILGKTARQTGKYNPHQLRLDMLRNLDINGVGNRTGRYSELTKTLPISQRQITDCLVLFDTLGYLDFERSDRHMTYQVVPIQPVRSYGPLRNSIESYISDKTTVTSVQVMKALEEAVMKQEGCGRKQADFMIARTMVNMRRTGRLKAVTGMKNTDTFTYAPNADTGKGLAELLNGIDAFEAADPLFERRYSRIATQLIQGPQNVQRALRAMGMHAANEKPRSIIDEVFSLLAHHSQPTRHLTAKEIVGRLNCSPNAVRTALIRLEQEGAIVAYDGVGAVGYSICRIDDTHSSLSVS
jgi:hypothetical protein